MTRTPSIPGELTKGPFTLEEARSAGLTPSSLKSKVWRRLGKAIYRWERANDDPWLLIATWRRALPSHLTFSGYTAAWMHGIDVAPTSPVEITVPLDCPTRSCYGLVVRHCELGDREIVLRRHTRTTSLPRTLRDLCVGKSRVDALIIIDAAVRRRLIDIVELGRYANQVAGLPGAARLRDLASLAAPAESPMETRLRWHFLTSGLSKPEVQVELHDVYGNFVGRADLYYSEARLVIEFDGGNHKDRLVSDNRRQNRVLAAGYTVLRFTSSDLLTQPDTIIAQVRAALASAAESRRFAQIRRNPAA